MPTISPFTEGLVIANYDTTNYSNELEMALLQKKQSQYNSIANRLSNLQTQALNISMLNLKGQEKLTQYNQELEDLLAGDVGDLTKPEIQAKVASYFNKISHDTDLKQRSRLSQHYQQQLSTIESMRASKDPTKSGYNSINETVFRKWTGGLEDFMLADSIEGWQSKMQSYTPYKDIDQKLVNLTKLLHAESQTQQKPVTQKVTVDGKEVEVPTGYDVLESDSGVSAERIRTLLEATLDQDERSQLDVLAKYRILENSTPEGMQGMYQTYNRWITSEHTNTKKQLERIKAIKGQFDPSKLDSKLPAEELAVKKAQYQAQLDTLEEQEQYLTTKLAQQITNQFSEEEWMKKDKEEIFPFIRQLTTEGYVNSVSDALSFKNEVQKVGMDETYFANLRIKNMQDRLALDAELGRAGLKLKEMELTYKMSKDKSDSENKFTSPEDIIKSEEGVFETWKKVTDYQTEFLNKTTPVITGKNQKGDYQIKPENLVNKNWLNQNQDNHEVKLWNAYVSRYRDDGAFLDDSKTKPNIAGFEVFKKQVENGDFRNDQSLNNLWDNYVKDQDVSNWLTEKTAKVANNINQSTGILETKLPGGDYTLADYAKANNWSPDKGELTFGIPTNKSKTQFKQMTWSEVKDEYQSNLESGYTYTASGAPVTTRKPSILDNDPEFKALVGKAIENESTQTRLIEEAYLTEMPQFLQGKQMISNDRDVIANMMGKINRATKLADSDLPLGLDAEDITALSVPSGIGKYGYFMISDKTSKNLEGRELVTVGGKSASAIPNTWYRYELPPANQYDIMQNAMFEDKGSVSRNIKGIKVTINNEPNSPNVTMVFKGSGLTTTQSVPRKDVSLLFKVAEQYIDQYTAQQSKPK